MMKQKMKKKQKKSQFFGVAAVTVFMAAMVLAIWSLSNTMGEIDTVIVSHSPEAILASAGVADNKSVYVSAGYFDQRSDVCVNLYEAGEREALYSRQFEWSGCGYYNKEIEQGIVTDKLGEDYLPVAKGGQLTPNRGVTDMKRWFERIEGVNESYVGGIKLEYQAQGAVFSFHKDEFYPLDEAEFSAGDVVNNDGHNHLFTMSFAVPFTALVSGDENFEITADDDTFVYVGDKLVIDMGGIHGATTGRFEINEQGEVYAAIGNADLADVGVQVERGEGSIVRIYHADRDSSESVFRIQFAGMNLGIVDSKLADKGGEAIMQVAYDPMDPTYVAPLGESVVIEPDGTKGFILIATIEGVAVMVFAILMAVALRRIVREKLQKE